MLTRHTLFSKITPTSNAQLNKREKQLLQTLTYKVAAIIQITSIRSVQVSEAINNAQFGQQEIEAAEGNLS